MQSEREGRRSKALEFVGKGDWKSAEESLRALVEEDQEDFEVSSLKLSRPTLEVVTDAAVLLS